LLAAALALVASWPSFATEVVSLVVRIADGDTIIVLDASDERRLDFGRCPLLAVVSMGQCNTWMV